MSEYDNYPDDIRNFDGDPRSPFHNDNNYEDAKEEIMTKILENTDIADYTDMFDCMDSDELMPLLRAVQNTQTEEDVNKLVMHLDKMLEQHAESVIEANS